MICAIMQPTYIPWIGYFDLIDKVDVFVFYNDVQLTKRSWQVRNRIKVPNGEVWLTIPIKKTKKRNETLIMDALPNPDDKTKIKAPKRKPEDSKIELSEKLWDILKKSKRFRFKKISCLF